MPTRAQAGFFSSLFGTSASADTSILESTKIDNSQNAGTSLQANPSAALDFQDQKSKDSEIKDDATVNTSGNALIPTTGLTGNSSEIDTADSSVEDTSVYVVRKQDTIAAIAKMFDVSVDTILWANGLKKGDKLKEGDTLIILPIDGVKHVVVKKDTLKKIAEKYKVEVSDIVAFNDITIDSGLVPGQELIIPDAEMTNEGTDKIASNSEIISKKDQDYYAKSPIKNTSGYFIDPLPTGPRIRKTQGLHDRGRAIDIGAPTGTPIYASASGKVLFAKVGYNGGFGNLVIIKHPNGTETYYAHQSKLATSTGREVSQGEVIGYVGSTGHSTGPHLHFEVRGARNPGADWSWATN